MKKLFAVLLTLSLLICIFCSCNNQKNQPTTTTNNFHYEYTDVNDYNNGFTVGDIRGEEYSSKDDDFQKNTEIYISKYNFDNFDEWGNILLEVRIFSPNGTNSDLEDTHIVKKDNNGSGNYVVAKEGTHYWEFYPKHNQWLASSFYTDFIPKSTDVYNYTKLNSNTLSVTSAYNSFTLRIQNIELIDGIPVFHILNGSKEVTLIPFKYIDTTKIPEFYSKGTRYYSSSESFDYYKIYLKK